MKDMSMWSRVDLESDLDDFKDQEDAENHIFVVKTLYYYNLYCAT